MTSVVDESPASARLFRFGAGAGLSAGSRMRLRWAALAPPAAWLLLAGITAYWPQPQEFERTREFPLLAAGFAALLGIGALAGGRLGRFGAGLALRKRSGHKRRLSLPIAVASFLWMIPLQTRSMSEDDVFQQAINYIFTGLIDPKNHPEIVDRKSCIVVVPEPNLNRYARYYLNRFKMDVSRISKKYAGRQVSYELEVEGDDIIFEYLKADKTTVEFGFKSAHISLLGNIDQTEKALKLVFAEHCKADKPKPPF